MIKLKEKKKPVDQVAANWKITALGKSSQLYGDVPKRPAVMEASQGSYGRNPKAIKPGSK